jgi:hypothetical protein
MVNQYKFMNRKMMKILYHLKNPIIFRAKEKMVLKIHRNPTLFQNLQPVNHSLNLSHQVNQEKNILSTI